MIKLQDIADIRSGYPFRERPRRVASGGVQIVQMRDIDGTTGWIDGDLEQVEPPANWESHRLHIGDVLLAARGQRNHAAQYAGGHHTVAASNLTVLRITEAATVIPPYLAWYLNLPQTQEQLRALRAGSNIAFIPIEALQRIPIRIPPIEMQNHLVRLQQLSAEEQSLLTQIQEKRRGLMAGIFQSLLRNQITNQT